MRRDLRTLLIGVSLLVTAGCGRDRLAQRSLSHVFGQPAVAKAPTWNLAGCDDACELVETRADTLSGLCGALTSKLSGATCATTPLDYKAVPASALHGAALVDLRDASGTHHALLSIQTAAGHRVARSLGKVAKIAARAARPVDLPGMAPAGVELRVDFDGAERLYVCGVDGSGKTTCPVGIQTSGSAPAGVQQMGAGIGQAFAGGWRARVELGPHGYVAHAERGELPAGLAGEHRYVAD